MADIKPHNYDTLLAPIITEKSTLVAEENKIIFRVPLTATKPDIKEAVENFVQSRRHQGQYDPGEGQDQAFSRSCSGRRSDFKKAIVTLKDGQSVDITTGL